VIADIGEAMAEVISFTNAQITQLSHLFGDEIMTGSEISRVLERIGIQDNSGLSTKWRRLEYAFTERQNCDRAGNAILQFIQEVLAPVNYVQNQDAFEDRRSKLNGILSFSGIQYRADGQFERITVAKTIDEAQKRVQSILPKLRQRGVHGRVLQYCTEELLKENYFHAVFEATKSLADRVRQMTNLEGDGTTLYDKAFSTSNPYLVLNTLQTESEKSQQKGFCSMLKGINSMVRNVTAHTPKIKWIIEEDEAIDILTTISFLHKNLDNCQVVRMEQ
jgi:TIGR02391 family protein